MDRRVGVGSVPQRQAGRVTLMPGIIIGCVGGGLLEDRQYVVLSLAVAISLLLLLRHRRLPGFHAVGGPTRSPVRHADATREGSRPRITPRILAAVFVAGAASVVLVGLAGPRFFCGPPSSRPAAARAQIEILSGALDTYRLDVGTYPSTVQGLAALVKNPGVSNWNGPYLKKTDVPTDPWNRSYKYACCPGKHGEYDLWSEGAGGAPGGDRENADIASWELAKRTSE
jgi:general secretion pathway protein G